MRRITTEEEEEGRSADPRRNPTDRTPAVAPTAMPIQAQFNTEIELEKMKEFFNQMNNMRFSSDKKEALSIIIDRINNDTPGEPIPTPAGLFESSKSKIRTEIHELLVEFAPESERRKNNGTIFSRVVASQARKSHCKQNRRHYGKDKVGLFGRAQEL